MTVADKDYDDDVFLLRCEAGRRPAHRVGLYDLYYKENLSTQG